MPNKHVSALLTLPPGMSCLIWAHSRMPRSSALACGCPLFLLLPLSPVPRKATAHLSYRGVKGLTPPSREQIFS